MFYRLLPDHPLFHVLAGVKGFGDWPPGGAKVDRQKGWGWEPEGWRLTTSRGVLSYVDRYTTWNISCTITFSVFSATFHLSVYAGQFLSHHSLLISPSSQLPLFGSHLSLFWSHSLLIHPSSHLFSFSSLFSHLSSPFSFLPYPISLISSPPIRLSSHPFLKNLSSHLSSLPLLNSPSSHLCLL